MKERSEPKARRALVSLPEAVWKIIDKDLKGKVGDGDSEIIRNIVMAHLVEKGYMLPQKDKMVSGVSPEQNQINQIAGELNMIDLQVEALSELLEEAGVLNYSAFDNRVKKKLAENQDSVRQK